jgi:hypothetical protein
MEWLGINGRAWNKWKNLGHMEGLGANRISWNEPERLGMSKGGVGWMKAK